MKKEIALNPMTVLRFEGEEVLREKLQGLDIEEMKFIIKEHAYDTYRNLTSKDIKNKEKLIDFIVTRAAYFITLGRVFRLSIPEDKSQEV